VEAFLYRAARIIDAGDLRGWLALCRPEMEYRVTTVLSGERAYDVGLIDNDYAGLESRIVSIERFWHAESPRTHTLHIVSNVEVLAQSAAGVSVESAFQLCTTRRDRQAVLYGRYRDQLVPVASGLAFARRTAVLEGNLLTEGKISFIV
jgi:3-phenylpropionate/cinnamic acid dioxygenase small subunit